MDVTRSKQTTMNGILHHIARSPHLRVMAWLAWLILVINPVSGYGAPLGIMYDIHSAAHVSHVAQASDYCQQAAPVKVDRAGCGDYDTGAGHICHCAETCCSLLPTAMAVLAPAILSSILWFPRRVAAPSTGSSPPLRPPRAV